MPVVFSPVTGLWKNFNGMPFDILVLAGDEHLRSARWRTNWRPLMTIVISIVSQHYLEILWNIHGTPGSSQRPLNGNVVGQRDVYMSEDTFHAPCSHFKFKHIGYISLDWKPLIFNHGAWLRMGYQNVSSSTSSGSKIECCLMILIWCFSLTSRDKPRHNAAHHLAEHLVVQPKCSLARVAPARKIREKTWVAVSRRAFSKMCRRPIL